jgi:hypothetical protein
MKKSLTLKEAQKQNRLEEFFKQQKNQEGNPEAIEKIISSMAKEKSPKVQEASSQEKDES